MPNAAPMPAHTREVFDYLRQCARENHTATYTEIANAVGLRPTGLGEQLNYISNQICGENGLPCLAALAVSANTGMPSAGWTPGTHLFGTDCYPEFWRDIVSQVYAIDWATVAI